MFSRIKNIFAPSAPASAPSAPLTCEAILNTGLSCDSDPEEVHAEVEFLDATDGDFNGDAAVTVEHDSCEKIVHLLESNAFEIGTVFKSMAEAKLAASSFSKCPVTQRSAKQQKYIYFECFRSGKAKGVTDTQRKIHSKKCNCPFKATLKRQVVGFEIIAIVAEHNHELYTDNGLEQLPQNRFIPDHVEVKVIELFNLGNLKINQMITLIEKQHFPDVKVTWTKRDIQNLTQKVADRTKEASDFLRLLEEKRDRVGNWSVRSFICQRKRCVSKEFFGCRIRAKTCFKSFPMSSKETPHIKPIDLECL